MRRSKPLKRSDQVSAFILTGGASTRMGRPKGLLEFGGRPLLLRTARLVEPLVSRVTLIGSPELYANLGLEVIEDSEFIEAGKNDDRPGPLAGIATALSVTCTDWNLILACDLPYLSRDWLDWLLARSTISDRPILMPYTAGGLEPLAAMYRRECGEQIIAALRHGVRKVTDAMEPFRIECVAESEWRHLDSHGRVLRNMNAPEDYEEARKWMEVRLRKKGAG
jgi:molybdenum cofactor guanylyltransferase